MRRPRMSTGAWIFATAALVLAVAAPVSFAAATSTVAIGNTGNGYTAFVDPERQLVTANGAQPYQIVHGFVVAGASTGCTDLWLPPSGKALVVTSVTYRSNSAATTGAATVALSDQGCFASVNYDWFDASQEHEAQHVFPTGLPVPSLTIWNDSNAEVDAAFTGYLIPVGQLPASATARTGHPRGTLRGRTVPAHR